MKRIILGKIGFVLKHILGSFCAGLWYYYFVFRCIDSHSFKESVTFLASFVAFFCLVGVLTEMDHFNDYERVVFNVVPGYGIYTLLVYFKNRSLIIITCLIVIGIISILYILQTIYKKKYLKKRGRYCQPQIIDIPFLIKKNVGKGLVLLMVIIAGSNLWVSG